MVGAAAAIPLPATTKSTFLFSSSYTSNFRILKVKANATLITNSDWFQVGRPIGNYGFMNVTTANTDQYSFGEGGGFKTQDVQEGSVKIRYFTFRDSFFDQLLNTHRATFIAGFMKAGFLKVRLDKHPFSLRY